MVFSQYKETCDVIIDNPITGGVDIKDILKKAIGFYIQILMSMVEVYFLIPRIWSKMYIQASISF